MTLSRREFFGRLLRPAPGEGPAHGETPPPADTGSLAGDLPPELLAMEAQRLGLDPETDRERLMAALYEAMLARGS